MGIQILHAPTDILTFKIRITYKIMNMMPVYTKGVF